MGQNFLSQMYLSLKFIIPFTHINKWVLCYIVDFLFISMSIYLIICTSLFLFVICSLVSLFIDYFPPMDSLSLFIIYIYG